MTNLQKLIFHVVNNMFPLNEYSDGEMKKLLKHFKDEAEDFELDIDDDRLEAYIKRFNQIKNGLDQKDIYKYSLASLIKLLSKTPKTIEPDKKKDEDVVPEKVEDELYRSEDEKILLVYGMNLKDGEPGCVRLKKRNESWCITQTGNSYWQSYRKRSDLGFPSFYLAYNFNLSSEDKLSSVALQARENNKYAYTDRTNNPGMSKSMTFDELLTNIPWLSEIPDLKSKLKWIPISKAERAAAKNYPYLDLASWKNLPYQEKLDYFEDNLYFFQNLGFNTGVNPLRDVNLDTFIKQVLPKYPDILKHFINVSNQPNGTILPLGRLLVGYNNFPEEAKKNIERHLAGDTKISTVFLGDEDIPFELKKEITKKRNWKQDEGEYVVDVPNKDIIASIRKSEYTPEPTINFYTPEQNFFSRTVNSRLSKYLIEDPNIAEILPFEIIAYLATNNLIDNKKVSSILGKYIASPKKPIISQKMGDDTVVLDKQSLGLYKLQDGKLTPTDYSEEVVNKIANTDEEKKSLYNNFINTLTANPDWWNQSLPSHLNGEAVASILNSMPYSKRTFNGMVLLSARAEGRRSPTLFLMRPNDIKVYPIMSWGGGRAWYNKNYANADYSYNEVEWEEIFKYFREQGTSLTDTDILRIMRSGEGNTEAAASKYIFARSDAPLDPNNTLKPVIVGDLLWIIDRENPAQSLTVSRSRGKVSVKPLTASKVRSILGEPAAAPQAAPAEEPAQGEEPAQAAAEAPAVQQAVAQGDRVNMSEVLTAAGLNINALPTGVRNRINQGAVRLATTNERGARSRNELLGNRGRVTAIYKLNGTASAVYLITLAGGTRIASIAMQPGNAQGILSGNRYYRMNSANDLATTLQANNINEHMNRENIKKIIREIVKQKLAENQPATAPSKPKETPVPTTKPGKPGEKPVRRPLGNPNVDPKPKALKEEEIIKKIAQRFAAAKSKRKK